LRDDEWASKRKRQAGKTRRRKVRRNQAIDDNAKTPQSAWLKPHQRNRRIPPDDMDALSMALCDEFRRTATESWCLRRRRKTEGGSELSTSGSEIPRQDSREAPASAARGRGKGGDSHHMQCDKNIGEYQTMEKSYPENE